VVIFSHHSRCLTWMLSWCPCLNTPWVAAFRAGSTRLLLTASRMLLSTAATILPHCAGTTLLLAVMQGDVHGHAPGHCNAISSSPSHSTWHPKSTAVAWKCKTSKPRMNSSVIWTTNTHVRRGRHHRVNTLKAKFKDRKALPWCYMKDVWPTWLPLE
jgi:hypothetical protein